MKLVAFFFTCLLLTLSGCSRDNNTLNSPSGLANVLRSGTWVVSVFSEAGNDKLYYFGGYSFVFNGSGGVTATKGTSSSAIGTWSSGQGSGKSTLYMDFGSSPYFEELNENWESLELTSSRVRLQHVSGGGGGSDYLTFELR